jgi:NAD(P)H-nitrite reductase large subunit
MSSSLFAEDASPGVHAVVEGVLALDALLKDLLHGLGPSAPALRVTVSRSESGDFVARPVEGGYDLHVAPGRDAGADESLLARVARELEVIEYFGAFVALYMEEGGVDSPAGFLRRVGLRYVRERIHRDPAGRASLFQRIWRSTRRSGTRCIARLASA